MKLDNVAKTIDFINDESPVYHEYVKKNKIPVPDFASYLDESNHFQDILNYILLENYY